MRAVLLDQTVVRDTCSLCICWWLPCSWRLRVASCTFLGRLLAPSSWYFPYLLFFMYCCLVDGAQMCLIFLTNEGSADTLQPGLWLFVGWDEYRECPYTLLKLRMRQLQASCVNLCMYGVTSGYRVEVLMHEHRVEILVHTTRLPVQMDSIAWSVSWGQWSENSLFICLSEIRLWRKMMNVWSSVVYIELHMMIISGCKRFFPDAYV